MKTINVVAAILTSNNKFMVAKRGYGEFKGLYEFPGGKVEVGESNEAAIVREIKEELDANIVVDSFFYHVHYDYDSFTLEMDCYLCHLDHSHITLLEHEDVKWVTVDEVLDYVPADIQVVKELEKRKDQWQQ